MSDETGLKDTRTTSEQADEHTHPPIALTARESARELNFDDVKRLYDASRSHLLTAQRRLDVLRDDYNDQFAYVVRLSCDVTRLKQTMIDLKLGEVA